MYPIVELHKICVAAKYMPHIMFRLLDTQTKNMKQKY